MADQSQGSADCVVKGPDGTDGDQFALRVTSHKEFTTPMIGISRIPSLFRIAAISDAGVGVPAWNLAGRLPRRRKAEAAAAAVSDQCSCALALAGHGEAYNEEAFQYLLSVERKRFERSNQPLFLMLVELDSQRGQASMDAPVAAKVFAGLGDLLRETDMIGWYREGRVVGALLTHHGDA